MLVSHTSKLLRRRLGFWDLVPACGVILSVSTALGFCGGYWWLLDLFSHFRVQYLIGLLVIALFLVLRRKYKTTALFGVVAALNLCTIAPFYFGSEPQPEGGVRRYRVMAANVNTGSGSPAQVDQAIRELNPDIVSLEEVNAHWISALTNVMAAYPYSQVMPREDNFGIALYSKYPMVNGRIWEMGEEGIPSAIAEVALPEGPVTVIATHPPPPAGAGYSELRDGQMAALALVVKEAKSPVMLVGDLNATPWSSPFKRMLSQSGLRDSSRGHGLLATWPTHIPLLLIPIDHCLHTAGISVVKRQRGPRVGSDHYPLVADFVVDARRSR